MAFLSGEQGAWSEGLAVLNDIPSQFELTTEEADAHVQMVAYYNLLSDLAQEGKTFLDADSLQLETLFDIEAVETGITHVFARNILIALGEIEYEEPIILPDLFKSSEAMADYEELLSKATEATGYIKVQPNPAKDYIIVEYDLQNKTGGVIKINNVNGNLKYAKDIFNKKDQLTVDTREWNAGIYIVTLKINGRLIESVKFTIID